MPPEQLPSSSVQRIALINERICHTSVTADSTTLPRVSSRIPLKPIKGASDYHFLLSTVKFTDPRRGHRILVASVIYERFLQDLSCAGGDMHPSTLVARFFLYPANVTRVSERLAECLERERAQFFKSHDRDAFSEPTHFTFFHEIVVKLARDEDDSLGAARIDEWVAQHGLERMRLLELGQWRRRHLPDQSVGLPHHYYQK